ncbi:MAG: hypothetical protein EOS71_27530 [Mesorhizobium sp.]|nr:hypothetical protein EOA35_37725 [Mesorhizobium sp. M8A.F.Ca.ET.023.01.1.1]RWC69632.1 MAG: hypothetical protein EOS71_27530 [Mesorhizobium sp.]
MLLFPLPAKRSFCPKGAGAPLLLPELARSSGREGGKQKTGRGFAPEGPAGDPSADSRLVLQAKGRRMGKTGFQLAGGERAEPFLPSQ